ncbi:MAG: hypothetical protein Q9202_001919 [Teloschistes flavicans]
MPVPPAARENLVVRRKGTNVAKVVKILVPRMRNAVGMMMEGFSEEIFENMCKGIKSSSRASKGADVLTWDGGRGRASRRANAQRRRQAGCGGGLASTIEGGAGAQIGCVPKEQNNWQGTYWSSWLAEARASGILKPGGKFRVKLGSFDCGTFTGTKRDLHERTSPILSSGNGMTVIASTAFGNLSNGTNAVIVPLTPDPEFSYPGK